MPKPPLTILAVNPGTRYLGLAVLVGPELQDWRVKVIPGADEKIKITFARRLTAQWMTQYNPAVLAVKRLHPSRSSPALRRLATMIRVLAQGHRLRLYQYTIHELEAVLMPGAKINKHRLAERLAAIYPALAHELSREQASRNPYHIRMFEAVALAAACYQRLDNQ